MNDEYLSTILNDEQIQTLESIGYFTSPASIRNHLSVEGGLYQHSKNVTKTMLDLNYSLSLGLSEESIIICGMLHDVCKCNSYSPNILKNGTISEPIPYKYTPSFIGHSVVSIYIIQNVLKLDLKAEEFHAITYHMGAFDENFRNNTSILRKFPLDMLLVWLMTTADTYATWIMEYEGGEE